MIKLTETADGLKTCTKCGRAKPVDEFYRKHGKCKECVRAEQAERDRKKREARGGGRRAKAKPEKGNVYRRPPHPGGPDAFEGCGLPFVRGRRSRAGV